MTAVRANHTDASVTEGGSPSLPPDKPSLYSDKGLNCLTSLGGDGVTSWGRGYFQRVGWVGTDVDSRGARHDICLD